jgi:hypothetical protein
MVIPDQTITGVSGLGANAPSVLRRTAELNPGPAEILSQYRRYTRSTARDRVGDLISATADSGQPFDPEPTPAIVGGIGQASPTGAGSACRIGGYHLC